VARLIGSLDEYIYDVSADSRMVHVHLYIGSEVSFEAGGQKVVLSQKSELPWDGRVEFMVSLTEEAIEASFALALRIPNWFNSDRPTLKVNGESVNYSVEQGYAKVECMWKDGDVVEWLLPIETKLIAANPLIRADAGKAAIQRGPLVYCVEEADNGKPLASLSLADEPTLTERMAADLLGGCVVVEGAGFVTDDSGWEPGLPYRTLSKQKKAVRFKAIPYYLWGNREPGEMSVWLRY
jgi:DUF1680 family protein